MTENLLDPLRRIPLRFAGETVEDFRARAAHQQAVAAERREHELAEQASIANSPEARIKIWERLHEIALPRSPSHRLIGIIAANTGLTIEQVRDEQQQRVAPAPAGIEAELLLTPAPPT